MKFVELGDRRVSVIGLGCWQFGSPEWGWGADLGEAAAKHIVSRALDLGVNLFDTAEIYGNGRSEEILGAALSGRRDDAFVATKVSPIHATRRGLANACSRSLARLRMEALDLYQIHWPNRLVPLSWTMAGMSELLESGMVRNVGVSNFSLRAWRRAERYLGGAVVSNQVQLNLLDRSALGELAPSAQERGRVIIAYSPLAQGLVGGKYDKDHMPADFRSAKSLFARETLARLAPLIEELRSMARGKGATPSQIALAWVLHTPGVIAIPGARTLAQVEENAAAADIELSEQEFQRLSSLAEAHGPRFQRPLLKRVAAGLLGW